VIFLDCKGLIHIYFGDGKGKTTAAVGLCVRCVGNGGKVLFYQFMKNGSSGEISILKKIDGVYVIDGYKKAKFVKDMTEEEKKDAEIYYTEQFESIINRVNKEEFDLLILDEAVNAINNNYISLERMIEFLDNKPFGLEIVLTGSKPDKKLFDIADYVSDILKIKHPFDRGIGSRKMIEK